MARKYLKQAIARAAKKAIRVTLKATAPTWVPFLFIFVMAYSAYLILFEIPKEAIADTTTSAVTKVEAFLGITEDPDGDSDTDAQLLDKYKEITNTWNSGLTQEQKKQVIPYKFPYSVLMAVDRVVNDEAVWDGKENVTPRPQTVFDVLRPKFSWKDSTITTVSNQPSGPNGEEDPTKDTKQVSLITSADTFEGQFKYVYEWQSTTSGGDTVTREVVKKVTPPAVYYTPLKEYLKSKRGIEDEDTFEVVANLAMTYDSEYLFNVALQSGQNFKTYPAYALAYADAVQQVLSENPNNIPQPLYLALIAYESGGNWRAVNNTNTNGTTDAGLSQINSVNWTRYGLAENPFDVRLNIQAGAAILGQAISWYKDFKQALYAYNGGTPSNGQTYNPSYAPAVLGEFVQLQTTPAFAVFVPAISGQPMTIVAAEQGGSPWQGYGQSGVNFTNPQEIIVVNERTGEKQRVERTSGDGTMWAQLAWVYQPLFKDVQKGDTINVQFPDGKNVEVKVMSV